ncbi:MAG: DNA-protecting protein DprA [Deltaproteobacteria bacterium]|nr:DNA-protecting protein DprA [Deltaproteobacteria bacterium]
MTSLEAWLALQEVLFAKPLLARQFLARFPSPEAVLGGQPAGEPLSPIEQRATLALRASVPWSQVQEDLRWCDSEGVHLLPLTHPAYPPLLAECPDAPLLLFAAGDPQVLGAGVRVAMVGARKATPYGRAMAERIAGGLAQAGVIVTSGLAIGIDGVCHRAALAAGGNSVGVLGGGLACLHPRAHVGLARELRAHGAVITEFPPHAAALAHHFPQRNRIISGISLGVAVIEAAERSGSLITARHALEQGRLVFAVPGAVDHRGSQGPHALIKQGAILVESAADLLAAIAPMTGQKIPGCQIRESDDMGRTLLPMMTTPQSLDTLVAASGVSAGAVLAWLTCMEQAGRVRAVPGNRYVSQGE